MSTGIAEEEFGGWRDLVVSALPTGFSELVICCGTWFAAVSKLYAAVWQNAG